MLPVVIANRILTVGPAYLPPKGGIAQTIYNYSKYVFPESYFRYVANSCDGGRIKKIYRLISSFTHFFISLLFNRSIRIVHIHSASNFSFKRSSWFVNIARLFNKKIIMHIHGGSFMTYYNIGNEAFVKKTLNKCDKIVVLTEEWQDWFRNELQCENVIVIPNVIPVPQPFEKTKGDGKFHLLFLGLINEEKGVFDLMQAIADSKEQLRGKFQFHIAGNGMVSRLKNEIDDKELQDIVKYEGWVDSIAKHELFSTCDALILPSYTEGLPLSILEAMSYHMPIISTPIGGIPSVIEDGTNGFLVEPGDRAGFIEKIMQLIGNTNLANTMGEESFKRIDKHFPTKVGSVLKGIYEELINYSSL